LEDLDVGGKVILRLIVERWVGVGWIGLTLDRDQCTDLVNTVMNLLVP
jgi:uncharacterized membrane protein